MITEGHRSAAPLLERESELQALEVLAEDGAAGCGRMALVEGPAGIGKTRLLEAARAQAAADGMLVLSARGGELEGDFGFGVVRQLLEPVLARAGAEQRACLHDGAARLAEPVFASSPPDPGSRPPHSVLHGLYWLVANLAEQAPLFMTVDDVHWADAASVRFLLHLAPRLDGLPVALCLSSRSGDPALDADLLRALVLEASPPVLRPGALSRAAVAQLAGDAGANGVSRALHEASGGNPFLVVEAIEQLERDRGVAGVPDPAAVRRLASERIAASLLLRVGRVDAGALALGRAIAVLGEDATAVRAGRLSGVDGEQVWAVLDALARAAILAPGESLAFAHPLVRTAIHEDMSGAQRAELHARAARLLAGEGAQPEVVALHLLAALPRADPWVVSALRDAAVLAAARGSPETAVSYLRRALREPPDGPRDADVLLELGRAEMATGDPAGLEHLRRAVAEPRATRSAETAGLLARALVAFGRQAEAVAAYDRAIAAVGDDEEDAALRLEAEAANAARMIRLDREPIGERLRRAGRRVTGDSVAEEMVLAELAHDRAVDNGPAAEVAALARAALRSGRLAGRTPDAGPVWDAVLALIFADELELAEQHLHGLLADGRRHGSLVPVAGASSMRALCALRRGDMTRTLGEADAALTAAHGGFGLITRLAAAYRAHALIERGELEAAELALGDLPATEVPDDVSFDHMLFERARLRLARDQLSAAVSDLALVGEHVTGWHAGGRRPVGAVPSLPGIEHRVVLVQALVRLGEDDAADRAAAEEARFARAWDTPRARGNALRARALVEPGERSIAALAEAVELLARSPGRLDRAHALAELGAALRRAGKRAEARRALERGMDLAHRCGALALSETARAELRLLGARPRRPAVTGVDSLTPSEYRVCEMAGHGMTNKEIAQALFVTLRTVEGHLTHSFLKLEVRTRDELPGVLGRRDRPSWKLALPANPGRARASHSTTPE